MQQFLGVTDQGSKLRLEILHHLKYQHNSKLSEMLKKLTLLFANRFGKREPSEDRFVMLQNADASISRQNRPR